MPRAGELTYYDRIGESGRQHARSKPFSDPDCGLLMLRVGALMSLLPPPPARILECGCGPGWLAYLLARRGYQVTATDVAPEAIRLAQEVPMFGQGATPQFLVADTEHLPFESEFDAVLFFDSLHHSVDEAAAVRSAFRALRPGGVCIALEPGRGHHKKSEEVEGEHDTTEKDMPPSYIWHLGRLAGFRSYRVFPAPQHLGKALYANHRAPAGVLQRLLAVWPFRLAAVCGILMLQRWNCGIAVLHKG
jgi:SAM-dependent methyltransferase